MSNPKLSAQQKRMFVEAVILRGLQKAGIDANVSTAGNTMRIELTLTDTDPLADHIATQKQARDKLQHANQSA